MPPLKSAFVDPVPILPHPPNPPVTSPEVQVQPSNQNHRAVKNLTARLRQAQRLFSTMIVRLLRALIGYSIQSALIPTHRVMRHHATKR